MEERRGSGGEDFVPMKGERGRCGTSKVGDEACEQRGQYHQASPQNPRLQEVVTFLEVIYICAKPDRRGDPQASREGTRHGNVLVEPHRPSSRIWFTG